MSAETILYLSERTVTAALKRVDPIAAVTAALLAHEGGDTILPAEAYLTWQHQGRALRSLSMPGWIDSLPGVKIINSNPANPDRGLPRASGLTVLFDAGTGRPVCILESSRISCVRTAAVTAIAAELLAAPPIERLALIGAGALCRCHLDLLAPGLCDLREVRVYDIDRRRASTLSVGGGASLVLCDSPEQAIRGADLIVPVTTTTTGYIRHDWLEPGALLVNVSLDDPLPEVVLRADKLFVDDWSLVAADERRLLGRMLRQGTLCGPSERGARAVDGELGQLLAGRLRGRRHPREIILVNPFGLAIEDLVLAGVVYQQARALGLGRELER
jgi:ornithine cyclodeaminase/alanine dehydrogenase-like protein (mu-crystallin family)